MPGTKGQKYNRTQVSWPGRLRQDAKSWPWPGRPISDVWRTRNTMNGKLLTKYYHLPQSIHPDSYKLLQEIWAPPLLWWSMEVGRSRRRVEMMSLLPYWILPDHVTDVSRLHHSAISLDCVGESHSTQPGQTICKLISIPLLPSHWMA